MQRIALVALLAASLAAPAAGQDNGAAAAGSPTVSSASAASEEKLICRTDDTIGSRVKKRKICLTKAQWRDVANEANMAHEKRTSELSRPGG